MRKILPLLVVGILVLGGLGAVATTYNEAPAYYEPPLEIHIKGGILGYMVTVKNVGNETVSGNLLMNITTDAKSMIIGDELSHDSFEIDIDVGESFRTNWGPVIGFGPATINVEGIFSPGGWGFEAEANGFVLLLFLLVSFDPIPIP